MIGFPCVVNSSLIATMIMQTRISPQTTRNPSHQSRTRVRAVKLRLRVGLGRNKRTLDRGSSDEWRTPIHGDLIPRGALTSEIGSNQRDRESAPWRRGHLGRRKNAGRRGLSGLEDGAARVLAQRGHLLPHRLHLLLRLPERSDLRTQLRDRGIHLRFASIEHLGGVLQHADAGADGVLHRVDAVGEVQLHRLELVEDELGVGWDPWRLAACGSG